jgi:putative oxidoreductase
MPTKWVNAPSSQPGRALDIVRFATALLLMVHSVFRIVEGDVGGFGEYLGSIFPLGVPLAWLITLLTLAASIALLIPRLVVFACICHMVVLVTGIVMIHAKAGWFVVGGGRNGMEYSVLLFVCLFALLWSYWPRGIQTA